MGFALEVIGAKVTNPGAGPTATTPSGGDQFTIRNFPLTSPAYLTNLWAQQATAGFIQVRSPRLHDNVRGLRERTIAATTRGLLADEVNQLLIAQDLLIIEASGGAAETDAYGLLVYYQDLPGISARLSSWDQIKPRMLNVLTIETTQTAPAVAGDWNAGIPLNGAGSGDLTKANTDYAVLGYLTDTACTSVAVRGPDTGNLRIGGPGTTESIETRDWFVSLSKSSGMPCIPVINSANKGATLVFVQNNAAAGTPTVGLIVAELSAGA